MAPAVSVAQRARPTMMRISQPISATTDEDFLYAGPATVRVPESLRSLHEITPSARDDDAR